MVVVKTKINNLPPQLFRYICNVSEGNDSPPQLSGNQKK